MKKVVIYPGRFQPMLPHHAEVYKKLQAQFPDASVYIATSDKVEMPKSPFNFKEKAEIMTQLHDIPADKIILAKSPYLVDSYKKGFDQENTMVIFAVGAKDEDRFPMSNVDTETGLDMTVRGEPRPKFYQMINTLERHPALPMSQRGYIYHAPNIDKGDVVASASAFRNAFNSATDNEHKKEIFVKYMGTFDQGVFDLLNSKIEKKMSEDINILKFLSGMLNEAPMDYSDDEEMDKEIDNTDDDGYKPGFAQKNMMTQLGKVADSEDASKDAEIMKVKKFDKITSVTTDDGDSHQVSGAEADALIKMFNMLSSQRAGEEESPREKFNRAIQKTAGLTQMLDFAKSKGLVKEETAELPTLDLADIRSDYEPELEEGGECYHCDGDDEDCSTCHGTGYAGAGDEDSQEPSQEEMDKHAKKESAPFGEPSQQEEAYEDLLNALQSGGEEAYAKACGLSMEDLDQEMGEISRDLNLHMDDDRDEILQRHAEDTVDSADWKDHGEPEVDEDIQRMRDLAGLGEMLGKDGKKPSVPYSKSTQADLDQKIANATPPKKDNRSHNDADEGETERFLRHMKQVNRAK